MTKQAREFTPRYKEPVLREVCKSEVYGRLMKNESRSYFLPDASVSQVMELIRKNKSIYQELMDRKRSELKSMKEDSISYVLRAKSFDLGQPLNRGENQ